LHTGGKGLLCEDRLLGKADIRRSYDRLQVTNFGVDLMQGTEKISWTNWAFVDRRVDVYAQQAVEDLLDNGLGEFDELRQGDDDLFFGEAR